MMGSLGWMAIASSTALGGGGPANVLVIYNADDSEGTEIARYYAEARDIPAGQQCGLEGLDPSELTISESDYRLLILSGVDDCLRSQANPDDIDYLVLTRGLP